MGVAMEPEPHKSEIIVRQYGLLDPLDWGKDCEEELRRMDLFWNRLVDIHEKYVDLYYAQILKDSSLAYLKDHYERLLQNDSSYADILAAKRKMALRQKEVSREMSVDLKKLELARRSEVKVARQNSELWWGNYNAIVRAFESARSAAVRSGNSVRRRREAGNGRFTNTLQGGAAVSELFDGSLSQVYIRQPQNTAWSAESRGNRRRLQRTILTATIYTKPGERRSVTWPMVMHRPIPLDVRVKNVVVTRRKIGDRWKWSVSITCSRLACYESAKSEEHKPVAIDIGWRRLADGLRVATALAPASRPRFVILPNDLLNAFAFVDELRTQYRESSHLGAKLIQSINSSLYDQPFREMLLEIQGCNENEYSRIDNFCRGSFFTEQVLSRISDEVRAWRSNHIKLSNWLANQQRKVVARRNHFYQNLAIALTQDASELIVADIKIGEMLNRRINDPEEVFFPRSADYYRIIAAPSKLRQILKFQCAKRHVAFKIKGVATPVRCPNCGSKIRKSRPDTLIQVCGNCSTKFDSDVVSCELLLETASCGSEIDEPK